MTSAGRSPLAVPDLVRQRATANGATGRRWLVELPEVVESLAARWGLSIGETFTGGTSGLVLAAVDETGRACVLKVAMPLEWNDLDSFRRSVRVHELAEGRGCARLYAHDVDMSALLMERLGRNLAELEQPVPRLLESVTETLRVFWRPVTEECGLPTGVDKTAWLADYITTSWDELGQPCARQVVDRALDYCAQRAAAFDPSVAVLVHGDAHGWNTVEAGEGTFKFVDPEGLRSEPAHDLGVLMREYNEPLAEGDTFRLTRERAELLAGWCDIDPEPVWQWGFIERVSTGMANIRDFDNDGGALFLEVATRCL